jgi:hypothetical protein
MWRQGDTGVLGSRPQMCRHETMDVWRRSAGQRTWICEALDLWIRPACVSDGGGMKAQRSRGVLKTWDPGDMEVWSAECAL